MKSSATSLQYVMTQLESWGSPNTRNLYARQSAGENQFGVTLGTLRGLAEKQNTDHPLAMQLWNTKNVEAIILATMLMSPAQLSSKDAERTIKPLTNLQLVVEFVHNVFVKPSNADQLRAKWMDSPRELTCRSGWKIFCSRSVHLSIDGLDFEVLLKKIESEILSTPCRKREMINCCLVEIGVHVSEFNRKCINLGEHLSRFDKRPIRKGCVSTYAPEWIAAVLTRSN